MEHVGAPSDSGIDKELLSLPRRPPKSTDPTRLNELPDNVPHIKQDFVPVGMLLSRLAQRSHNELRDTIKAMAQIRVNKQLPESMRTSESDNTARNLQKKELMLRFAQRQHEDWVKALVITHWSHGAEEVSRIIDLVNRMWTIHSQYMFVRDALIQNKESLTFARLPAPDIKSALHIMSNGNLPMFPEFGFIPPPPISAAEQSKFLYDLDTLLCIRLNLDDHDRIPYQFRNFRVHDGRVTFVVKDEFELDLTIADDDFSKQYWFVDFRFLFTPTPAEWTPRALAFFEQRVNQALFDSGLDGCYHFVHEFVLTCQIGEFRRQAINIINEVDMGTLSIEPLHRALAIHYWPRRGRSNQKSWIMLGVVSNGSTNRKGGAKGASTSQNETEKRSTLLNDNLSSSIILRWFREGKEVDHNIRLSTKSISTRKLLNSVIGRHVEFILSTIHSRLFDSMQYMSRQHTIELGISRRDPANSYLSLDLGRDRKVILQIVASTGFFRPCARGIAISERAMNNPNKIPIEACVSVLDSLRIDTFIKDIRAAAELVSLESPRMPVSVEDTKDVLRCRNTIFFLWFRTPVWDPSWFLLLNISNSGDQWYLVQLAEMKATIAGMGIKAHTKLPVRPGQTQFDASFFNDLVNLATTLITSCAQVKDLREQKIPVSLVPPLTGVFPPSTVKVPSLEIELSSLLPSSPFSYGRLWKAKSVLLELRGRDVLSKNTASMTAATTVMRADARQSKLLVAEAILPIVQGRSCFDFFKTCTDPDVTWDSIHSRLLLRIRHTVGKSIVDVVASRLRALDRLVIFVEACHRAGPEVECTQTFLHGLVFSYRDKPAILHHQQQQQQQQQQQPPQPPQPPQSTQNNLQQPSSQHTQQPSQLSQQLLQPPARQPNALQLPAWRAQQPLQPAQRFPQQAQQQASSQVPQHQGQRQTQPEQRPALKAQGRQWQIKLGLSDARQVSVNLSTGSPHTRVAAELARIANCPKTCHTLPSALVYTLGLHVALNKVEEQWTPLIQSQSPQLKCKLTILCRNIKHAHFKIELMRAGHPNMVFAFDIGLRTSSKELHWLVAKSQSVVTSDHDTALHANLFEVLIKGSIRIRATSPLSCVTGTDNIGNVVFALSTMIQRRCIIIKSSVGLPNT